MLRYIFQANSNPAMGETVKIDLKKITPETKRRLLGLFKEYKSKDVFLSGTPYEVRDTKLNNKLINYQLSHRIYKRKCNPDGKHKGQERYEIVAVEPMKAAGFGPVYPIESTLVISSEGDLTVKIKPLWRRRAVRIDTIDEKCTRKEILHNYEFSLKAGHLAVKLPVFANNIAFSTMRLPEGKDLKFLIAEKGGYDNVPKGLSYSDCSQIITAIIYAYEVDVANKNMVHRDITLEKIMINSLADFHIAQFSDYKNAKSQTEDDSKQPVKINEFTAPELLKGAKTTTKSDIYALGVVFEELLFNCHGLLNWQRWMLDSLILKMMEPYPENRYSMKEVNTEFRKIHGFFRKQSGQDIPHSIDQHATFKNSNNYHFTVKQGPWWNS